MKNILIVFGTRPEVIKLAPVILELKKYPQDYRVILCNSEQQKELSNQTLSFFGLKADISLDVMSHNQTLPGVQSRILDKLSAVYAREKIDATIVQGDTMSVFCAGLLSFYNKIPVFHVEAGLRSHNLNEPFPEEAIRQMTSRITALHFAPTQNALNALVKENIKKESIVVTGNTVIDALFCLSKEQTAAARVFLKSINIPLNDKLVLITAHRRENHGKRLDDILSAVTTLASKYRDHTFLIPVHPNPNVKGKVHKALSDFANIKLTEPLDYPVLAELMKTAKLIMTDSGGIQEEAPAFGAPILVLRYETERKEGVEAGFSKLLGADKELIVKEASAVLSKSHAQSRILSAKNPYGDGKAAQYIVKSINSYFNTEGL
ncbi:MAG: UDP-N-acetylglucosamine 2-epimerase (non-hydrolyzing) [Elusimicrobiota bacterium]|jgi:UDP-N-acetylglucosamine 2-epimerase (non-hydrolysing)|nr:UDP-N-acetylglucosamine 2-epimerase (non-hydrolyzing) [Elusimicrobiota bacterium]